MFWNFVVVIGIVWIFQSVLAFMQTILINNALTELSKKGKVVFERNAGLFRTRQILFLSVNEKKAIVAAKKLRTVLFLVPPKISPFDELVGLKMSALKAQAPKYDKTTQVTMERLLDKYNSKGK